MKLSVFSVLMAVLFSSLIIFVIHLLRKKAVFLKHFGVSSILFLYVISGIRLLFAFEFPFTKPIPWEAVLNPIFDTVYFAEAPVGDFSVSLVDAAAILWGTVSLILTVCLLVHFFAVQKRASGYEVSSDPRILEITKSVRDELHRVPVVSVCVCPDVEIPMGFGIRKRRILLPDREYSDRELYYILKHEMVHFCNRDTTVIFLVTLFSRFFWWNPLVYLLKKDVMQMLEIKCDLTVTQGLHKNKIIEYLTTIVDAIKAQGKPCVRWSSAATVQLIKDNKGLSVMERFQVITCPDRGKGKRMHLAFVLLFTLLLMGSYTFVLQPSYEPPIDEINTDGYIEMNNEGAYLLKHKDGTWSYVLPDGTVGTASEETARVLIQDGIEVMEE